MTELVAADNYIRPRTFEELGGELGLTAEDIAKGLGVPLRDVHRKIRRNKWCQNKSWGPVSYDTRTINNNRYQSFIFSLTAAKVFVARWANNVGDAYLHYLIEYERTGCTDRRCTCGYRNKFMKLRAQMYGPKKKKDPRVKFEVPVLRIDLAGNYSTDLHTIDKLQSELTNTEKELYDFYHRMRVSAGVQKKNIEKFPELFLVPKERKHEKPRRKGKKEKGARKGEGRIPL